MISVASSCRQVGRAIRSVYASEAFWDTLLDSTGSGPFDGGCLVCARALCSAFGGELVHLARTHDGRPDHYGARIGGALWDFDGPAPTPDAWIERFRSLECVEWTLELRAGLGEPVGIQDCTPTASAIARMLSEAAAALSERAIPRTP